jgi:hypothetical protein
MAQMQTMEKVKVAGFVDRGYNAQRRQKRIEDDEAEIKRLEAELRGEQIEEEADEEVGDEEEVEEGNSEAAESTTEGDDSSDEDGGKNLTAEERSFKKRYGDLRRYSQEKEKALKEEIERLKSGAISPVLPPKSDEDLDAWAKKYPDVAAIVETIAKKQAQKLFEQADSRLKDLDKIARETEIAKAEAAIRKSHPDFDKLRSSDEFHDWAEAQPKWVQDALYENADDPASVVRVIDLYKSDKGITASAKKDQKKDAAKEVAGKSRITIDDDGSSEMIRESQVARMSDKEFETNYEKIIKAQKTGKFIYDISGKAR